MESFDGATCGVTWGSPIPVKEEAWEQLARERCDRFSSLNDELSSATTALRV